jgi:hypothetical protein
MMLTQALPTSWHHGSTYLHLRRPQRWLLQTGVLKLRSRAGLLLQMAVQQTGNKQQQTEHQGVRGVGQ